MKFLLNSDGNAGGGNDSDPEKKGGNDFFSFFNRMFSDDDESKKKPGGAPPRMPGPLLWIIIAVLVLVVLSSNVSSFLNKEGLIPFSEFRALVESGDIVRVELSSTYFTGYGETVSGSSVSSDSSGGTQRPLFFLPGAGRGSAAVYRSVGLLTENFIALLDEKGVEYSVVTEERNYVLDFVLQWILPFAVFFLMWRYLMRRMGGGLGGSIFSAGQSRSAAVEEGKVATRFSDVAGVDEAKEELEEVVDFLKNPKKYTEIGGKIPRGVLLVGPPGTGKTLLARAVAGEAGVSFFRISGSDFVEMFVGVGASRVRDLFKQAREKAPCIIFIDELDAIGKSRINSLSSNDEREQTLNQLLVEMDGFDGSTGLILLAATNRPDVLDPALLRPGRFDRQIVVDRPDVKGREQILKIHSKGVKIGRDVDLAEVAKSTSGSSGADLANIVNEAALLAVRAGRKEVTMEDFNEAVEKAVAGLQKKSRVIREDERRIVAYHETGHAIVTAFTPKQDKVHKISIIPRGLSALGYTMQLPEEDKYLSSEEELLGHVDVLLGGRAAEEIVFGSVSTGAANDLSRATDIIRRMITDYGMSGRFRNVALSQRGAGYGGYPGEPQLVRDYSEHTQQYIDDEIARITGERYERVKDLLKKKEDLVKYVAERLLEKEIIEGREFEEIVNAEKNLMSAD